MSNKIITLENLRFNNEQMKLWVEGIVAGKVDYLGVVGSAQELAASTYGKDYASAGDYCRASAQFYLDDGEEIHPGDIIIYKGEGCAPISSTWDIIHTEDPGNYVDLISDQTITGKKTFDAESTFNSSVFIKNYDGSHTTALDGMVLALPKANGDNLVISASSIMVDDSASGTQSGKGPQFPTMNFAKVSGTLLVDTNLTNGSLSEIVLDVDNMKTWTSTINGYGIEVKNPVSVARYGGEDIALSLNGATYQFNFPIFSLPEGITYGVNTFATQEWVQAQGYGSDSAPAVYSPTSDSVAPVFYFDTTNLKTNHLYKVIFAYEGGSPYQIGGSIDIINNVGGIYYNSIFLKINDTYYPNAYAEVNVSNYKITCTVYTGHDNKTLQSGDILRDFVKLVEVR